MPATGAGRLQIPHHVPQEQNGYQLEGAGFPA
jgi:hypothetical protein